MVLYGGRERGATDLLDMDPVFLKFHRATSVKRHLVLDSIPNTIFEERDEELLNEICNALFDSELPDSIQCSESLEWGDIEEFMNNKAIKEKNDRHNSSDTTQL